MIQYFPIVTGSLVVLGNVSVSGSINASGSVTISGSIASASYALSASNAATASSADNFLTRGTLTAQTIVVQTITSSVDFVTGSTRFGSLSSNTHVFTGSMSVTGGLAVNAGNVGIGTTPPANKLTVYGTGDLSYIYNSGVSTTDANFYVYNSTTDILMIRNSGNVGVGMANPTSRLHVSGTTGGVFEVDGAAAVTALYVSASGNVGIGTTSPQSQTHIYTAGTAGNGYYEGALQVGGSSTTLGARLSYSSYNSGRVALVNLNNAGGSASTIDFGFGVIDSATGRPTSSVATITQAGNVGIGTTGPLNLLHVRGAGTSTGTVARFAGTGPSGSIELGHSGNGGLIGYANLGAGNQANVFYVTTGAGTIGSGIVMNNGGNVGIGTTSPAASDWNASSTLLHIYQNSTNGSILKLGSSNAAGVVAVGNNQMQIATTTDDPMIFYTNSAERMLITSGGNLQLKNPYYLFLNSTSTTTLISGLPTATSLLISVTIQWSSNSAAQRTYLLHVGATTTAWGSPNSGITTISSLDWSSGYVGAATFSVGGSGSSRTLDISVSGANTYNVDVYASMVRFGY